MQIDVAKLAEPFDPADIEWRVSQAGRNNRGIWCKVLAYITSRAVQQRLDEVCGADRWRIETPLPIEVGGKAGFCVGISINFPDAGWVTKWDAAECTQIEPIKGGYSGAVKRAGAQWGIGRYLYHLPEQWVSATEDPSDEQKRKWNRGKLPKRYEFAEFLWETPKLPSWALPKPAEHEITSTDLNLLKREWKEKFLPDSKSPAELRDGFVRFVESEVGSFPHSDHKLWTKSAWEKCLAKVRNQAPESEIDSGVPFDA